MMSNVEQYPQDLDYDDGVVEMVNVTLDGIEDRTPGIIRTISGNIIDIANLTEEMIDIEDIAWGLGRQLRYNGHILKDYFVAQHCIIMSYAVPESHALEALLHDAAEAYIGDLIWPFKALFPEIEAFENSIALKIMDKFECPAIISTDPKYGSLYAKSKVIRDADLDIFQHECMSLDRPGMWHDYIEKAWLKAAEVHQDYWYSPQHAYLQRFQQLTGVDNPMDVDLEGLSLRWYREEVIVAPSATDEETQALIESLVGDAVQSVKESSSNPDGMRVYNPETSSSHEARGRADGSYWFGDTPEEKIRKAEEWIANNPDWEQRLDENQEDGPLGKSP